MTNGGQIHDRHPATTAARSPIVRRPTRQTTTAVIAEIATGTSRSVTQPLPATQNSGTVARTSCEPPYACPQKYVVSSPPLACRAISPTTASSLSGTPSAERWTHTRRTTPATPASATSSPQRHEAGGPVRGTGAV